MMSLNEGDRVKLLNSMLDECGIHVVDLPIGSTGTFQEYYIGLQPNAAQAMGKIAWVLFDNHSLMLVRTKDLEKVEE